MTIPHYSIRERLRDTAFFGDLHDEDIERIARLTVPMNFTTGELIAEEGAPADSFYVIEAGTVSVEIHESPWGIRPIATLGPGEVFGWSWAFPPFLWHFDCRAMVDGQGLCIDAEKFRTLLEAHPTLGYEIMKRLAHIFIKRLAATRLQLLDLYR